MAMHKPDPWIISSEPDSHPSARRHTNSVSFNGINKIEASWVCSRIKVSFTLSHYVEIKSMKVERMVFKAKNVGTLNHQLHGGVVWQHHHFCTMGNHGVVGWATRVIKWIQRGGREISGENCI